MKKLFLIAGLFLLIIGCQKQKEVDQPIDRWNGYEAFLKTTISRTLWAGQHIDVGDIIYEFLMVDGVETFRVTYTTEGGWVITETHLFAGLKSSFLDVSNKYVNKQLTPRIGLFPYSTTHNPGVTVVVYDIPVAEINGWNDGGIILATHAVVTRNGQTETAWGDWDYTFNDKRWGGYSDVIYNKPAAPPINPIAYGIGKDPYSDEFILIMTDLLSGNSNIISIESAGGVSYDGVSLINVNELPALIYNESTLDENGNGVSNLIINDLTGETEPYIAGALSNGVESAFVYNGTYYYLSDNQFYQVTLSENEGGLLEKVTESLLEVNPVPGFTAYDMTVTPDGLVYVLGLNGATMQIISLDLAGNSTVFDTNIQEPTEASLETELVYTEETLYFVTFNTDNTALVSSFDPTSGESEQIGDNDMGGGGIIISDLGRGPLP